MFVREKAVKAGGKTHFYVQIVRSVREGKKVKQEVVCSLGNREKLDAPTVNRLVGSLAKYGTVVPVPRPGCPDQADPNADPGVGTREGRQFGDVFVLDHVWRELGLRTLLKRFAKQRRFRHDLERATFAMVANRLIDPSSKLRTETWLDTKAYMPLEKALTADHLYKTLLWLHEEKDELEVAIHRHLKRRGLTGGTVYFYDTTLTHLEGRGPEGLAQVAGRKGRRPGKQHILVGLLTTSDGWPVAYHLFPGASNDVPCFKRALRDMYQRLGLREIVIICDRGMHSEEVVSLLEDRDGYDYRYIVATRLRKVKEVSEQVLSRAGRYRKVEEGLDVKEVHVEGRRYLVCRNQASANRDRRRREEIVARIEQKVGDGIDPSLQKAIDLQASGNKRYLTVRNGLLVLDRKAVKDDARYEGKWVLRTNLRELDPGAVALRYKAEARIERSMLTIKDTIGLRPFHHHHEEWVSGHVFVCNLALLVYRALQERLGTWPANRESIEGILDQLADIRAEECRVGREDEDPQYFWNRSDLLPNQKDLIRRLGIKKLPRVLAPPVRLDEKARERTQSRRERRRKEPRQALSPDTEVLQ